MEPGTILALSIQFLALFSIAGALLFYLFCKGRGTEQKAKVIVGGTILVTSVDSALGLQICIYLASKGCRVFAGMKDLEDSLPAKLLKAWMKQKETSETPVLGTIIPIRIDVTREDVLHEATESIVSHLNVGEKGILAIINTAGSVYKGRIENQDVCQWDAMFKTNVMGSLRIARAFMNLLKPTRGRLIYFGTSNSGDNLVVFTASRIAVEGCTDALRKELQPFGVNVISLHSQGLPAESLYCAPVPYNNTEQIGAPTQYSAEVLDANALSVIEQALFEIAPDNHYDLLKKRYKPQMFSGWKLTPTSQNSGTVQRV